MKVNIVIHPDSVVVGIKKSISGILNLNSNEYVSTETIGLYPQRLSHDSELTRDQLL